jgi:hypothetical protein
VTTPGDIRSDNANMSNDKSCEKHDHLPVEGFLRSVNLRRVNRIKVKKHSGGYALCQSHYIEKVLLKFKHLGIKEANTHFDSSIKLNDNSGRVIAQLEYASAIGSMMFAMHCTRPDIAFAVYRLSRYTSYPSINHWKAIARLLGYLKRTINLGLFYSKFPSVL